MDERILDSTSNSSEDQSKYKTIQKQISNLKAQFDQDRINLIREQFPEIVSDAERFLESVHELGTYYTPWEYFSIEDDPNAAEEIQDKYDIRWHRQRPGQELVQPRTDLFYEISEILFDRKMVQLREQEE